MPKPFALAKALGGFNINFISLGYAVFFLLVVVLYYALPKKFAFAFLLFCSYFFYAFVNPALPAIIFVLTAAAYFCAVVMAKNKSKAFLCLAAFLCVNFATLLFLKYLPAQGLPAPLLWHFAFFESRFYYNLLPVGLAFFSLNATGLLLGFYSGKIKTLPSFGQFALCLCLFPQLLAGPLQPAESLLPQLRQRATFSTAAASSGLRLILWGLFKKVLVADYIAAIVNPVFKSIRAFSGLSLFVAALLFTLQLYADISAYCNIAQGCAQLLGINFSPNFSTPFFAKSFTAFWGSWFTSLGNWFRQYVYLPAAKSKWPIVRFFAVFLAFAAAAVWHRPSAGFFLWAVLQSIFVATEAALAKSPSAQKLQGKKARLLRAVYSVFVFLGVVFSFAILRLQTLGDIGYFFSHLHRGLNPLRLAEYIALIGVDAAAFAHIAICLLPLLASGLLGKNGNAMHRFKLLPAPLRYVFYYALAFFVALRLFTLPAGIAPGFLYYFI